MTISEAIYVKHTSLSSWQRVSHNSPMGPYLNPDTKLNGQNQHKGWAKIQIKRGRRKMDAIVT